METCNPDIEHLRYPLPFLNISVDQETKEQSESIHKTDLDLSGRLVSNLDIKKHEIFFFLHVNATRGFQIWSWGVK